MVDISNECYYMIEYKLKMINEMIASLDKDLKNTINLKSISQKLKFRNWERSFFRRKKNENIR